MSEKIEGTTPVDRLQVEHVRPIQPARPISEREQEEQGRRQDRRQDRRQNRDKYIPPPAATNTIAARETVTISLERYEKLKQAADQFQQWEKDLQSMLGYSLLTVRGQDRPLYKVTVDRAHFANWLARLNQGRLDIGQIEWREQGGKR